MDELVSVSKNSEPIYNLVLQRHKLVSVCCHPIHHQTFQLYALSPKSSLDCSNWHDIPMGVAELRAKKSHHSKTGREFSVTLQPTDANRLDALSQTLGVSRPEILRQAFRGIPLLSTEQRSILIDSRSSLAHVGANLNQIAKHLNSGGNCGGDEVAQAAKAVIKTVAIIRAALGQE